MTTDLKVLLNQTLAGRIVKQMDQNDVTKNDNKIEAQSWNSIMDQIGCENQKIGEGETMSMLKAITLLTKMACADAAKAGATFYQFVYLIFPRTAQWQLSRTKQ